MPKRGRLMYSTDGGNTCPTCKRPRPRCTCKTPPSPASSAADGVVRVGRATQGKKGRGVTTITGAPVTPLALAALAKELKQACGSGGTVKNGVIEIQGEHRDRLVELLRAKGWTVKRAGG